MLSPNFQQNFALRRRMRGYLTGIAVAAVVSVGMVFRIVTAHDWRLVASLEIAWIMIAVWVYIGLRYQVLWRDEMIVMKALGRPDVTIAPDEIIQMAIDTGERLKIAGIGAPSERIKILAKQPDDAPKAIYVSLGHFVADDVLLLMRIINAHRPDLAFPPQWLQSHGPD